MVSRDPGSGCEDGQELTTLADGSEDQCAWRRAGLPVLLYTEDTVMSLASWVILVNSEREA